MFILFSCWQYPWGFYRSDGSLNNRKKPYESPQYTDLVPFLATPLSRQRSHFRLHLFLVPFPVPFLKGTVSRDFRPSFFSLNGAPRGPDSWAKAVLNSDSNSRRNSIRFDAENRLFLLHNAKLLFNCHGAGKITYDRCFARLLL
jgi:hypothetical protein